MKKSQERRKTKSLKTVFSPWEEGRDEKVACCIPENLIWNECTFPGQNPSFPWSGNKIESCLNFLPG